MQRKEIKHTTFCWRGGLVWPDCVFHTLEPEKPQEIVSTALTLDPVPWDSYSMAHDCPENYIMQGNFQKGKDIKRQEGAPAELSLRSGQKRNSMVGISPPYGSEGLTGLIQVQSWMSFVQRWFAAGGSRERWEPSTWEHVPLPLPLHIGSWREVQHREGVSAQFTLFRATFSHAFTLPPFHSSYLP